MTANLPEQGFRPAQRLHRPAEFAAVFAQRQILRGSWFDLLVAKSAQSGSDAGLDKERPARLGLVVPKRLLRAAILRNAVKRQAREAFRLGCKALPQRDMVLRLSRKPTVAGKTFKREARKEIEGLFARLIQR